MSRSERILFPSLLWRSKFTVPLTVGCMVASLMVPFSVWALNDDHTPHFNHHSHKHSHNHHSHKHFHQKFFQRIATFPVFLNTDIGEETVSEIVDATKDGKLLVYTDSANENIGFVNIQDPSNPQPDGIVDLAGEPTSVAILKNKWALATVNTSQDFVNVSGQLQIVNINSRQIVRSIELGGQPDSIAISPNEKYAVIAIENERDEDLGSGEPPQAPAGFIVIVDIVNKWNPNTWTTRVVDLENVPGLFPEDPEPEYVDINEKDIAAVTMQENNWIALIDLKTGTVKKDWDAGKVDLDEIDTNENDLIELNSSLEDVPREPDAVTWISNSRLATADEGDLFGGSRGFTIFKKNGDVDFSSGHAFEHLVARIGHYPEGRSENKGSEPEAVEYGEYGKGYKDRFLFVGSERASVVAVYRLDKHDHPHFVQVLPAGLGPEGVKAIPNRDLLIAASENDSRKDKFRGTISIYQLKHQRPTYPTILSNNRPDGTPIPWAALSALAADPSDPITIYTAHDSFFKESRLYKVDVSNFPAEITEEIILKDGGATVNFDVEGVTMSPNGGFWVVSEGHGSVDDASRPVTSLNLLLRVASDGTILKAIQLPAATNALQRRFGFEGVAAVENNSGDGEFVYVAVQREWVGDPNDQVRIARYDTKNDEWRFFYYTLDLPTSPNGGWVGLSEIVALDAETFLVLERDNQAGPDARIKKIYQFSINGLTPDVEGGTFPVIALHDKKLVRDLIPDLEATKGLVLEKVEGLAVLSNGDAFIVTDNDGVDDATGETQLINLGSLN